VTVRDETEWVELVETGANFLAGMQSESIWDGFQRMKGQSIKPKSLYGDGDSAKKVVKTLLNI
jgi:UDP-GlcNAc3NAcA epimerase